MSPLQAAEQVRFYTLGEDDPGAEKGQVADETFDTIEFQETDDIGPLVTLEGFGTYTDGRDGDDSFGMAFDGSTDFFESIRFDPRDFGGSFTSLSQAWVKPDSESDGIRQQVWALGTDNGGVAVTEDGFWELVSGGSAGSIVSPREVAFDEWVHLAVFRFGNGGRLYVNGSLVVTNDGFWNAPGTLVLGAGPLGEEPFHGVIDDFIVSGFGDGSFDPVQDIVFFDPDSLSGILGDVNQDSLVNTDDYFVWSANVGFDNGLGVGDTNTLFIGDVDQNGRVNYFDFEIIRTEAAAAGTPIAVPEPGACCLLLCGLIAITCLHRNTCRRAA